MGWKVYYGDGSTFSGDDGEFSLAPARGVQVIVQDHPGVGMELVTGADYYVWGGCWRGVDIFGLFDYLIEPGMKKVIFGRTITQDEYNKIMRGANLDKSGWLSKERRVP